MVSQTDTPDNIPDKTLVDLDTVEIQSFHQAEGRISCSEIICRYLDPMFMKFTDIAIDQIGIHRLTVLCQLQSQILFRKIRLFLFSIIPHIS